MRFINQAAAYKGVVVRPVKGLLETPVELVPRRGSVLQRLELLKRRVNARVGQERPLPVLLQLQESLREAVGVFDADEVTAIVPQNVGDICVRRASQRTPGGLFTSSLQPPE